MSRRASLESSILKLLFHPYFGGPLMPLAMSGRFTLGTGCSISIVLSYFDS